MAEFPIQYSQRLPSGRSTAAPITADVTAPSRALSQAGGVLAQFGQKIQQAEDAMEFSTLKRQSEEIWNAAYNTMLSTPDPESRAKVYEKAKKDMSGLSAKSRRVQDKFQMHLNNALPQYDVYAADLDRKKRIQSAKAELETNGKYYLENGDLLGYQSLLKDGLDTGLLEEAEYQYMQENAETNSKFAQVRVLMDSNPQMAVQILDSMPDLTGEQLDQKDKLVRTAHSIMNQRQSQSDAKRYELVSEYQSRIVNGDVDIESMVQEVASTPGLSAEDRVNAVDDVSLFFRNWGSTLDRPSVSDSIAVANMEKAVDDLAEGRITKSQYFNEFANNKTRLSQTHQDKYLQETEQAINRFTQNLVRISDDEAKARIISYTDAAFDALQAGAASGKISGIVLNAAGLKRQAQMIIYSDFQRDLFELKSKLEDLPDQEFRNKVKALVRFHSGRDWMDIAKNNEAVQTQIQQFEKQIAPEFDRQLPNIKDAWKNLEPTQKALVIDMISKGSTMEDVIRAARSGQI